MKPRKTLQQMASADAQPVQIAGKPANTCPYCGCGLYVDGVNRTSQTIVRYVECRNKNCKRRFMSSQPPAKIVREIGEDSASGKPSLTLIAESA